MASLGRAGAWFVGAACSHFLTETSDVPHAARPGFEDYKFEDGKLHFTNVWVRKPKSNYKDGNTLTVEPSGENHVQLIINNGKQKIKHESARLKR